MIRFYGGSKDTATGATTARYADTEAGTKIHFSATYLTNNTDWTPNPGAIVTS